MLQSYQDCKEDSELKEKENNFLFITTQKK